MEANMSEETRARISDVATVAIPVEDQERALEFYVGKLGFEKRRDATFGAGQRWVEVAPPGAATTIALVPRQSGTPTRIRFTSDHADGDHEHLLARGVDADPEEMRLGGAVPPLFTFRDPDGNS